MRHAVRIVILVLIIALPVVAVKADDALKYFDMGDFRLENGQTIRDCKLGYRTFGTLNQKKSNVLLFPTWFSGTSQDPADLGLIGPGKLADTSKYYVIVVDAFGNGVSSSPSTSKLQPGTAFPRFSVRDMVVAQHALVTRHLGLTHLYAVVGISMGGMQAFQWLVSYPTFFDKAVAISGTPRLTAYDLLVWQIELQTVETNGGPGQRENRAMRAIAPIHVLLARTPHYFATSVRKEKVADMVVKARNDFAKYDSANWAWQIKAMMGHDIYRPFGGSPEKAAGAAKAQTLIVIAKQDHLVYPEPSRAFGELLKAKTSELASDCGHLSFLCDMEHLRALVVSFLEQ